MPFCSSCGKVVHDRDLFCGSCGPRQQTPGSPFGQSAPPPPPNQPLDALDKIPARTVAIFCYIPVVGWLAAVVVLASQRFRTNIGMRFHAFQGLYLFAAWLVIDWA